MPLYEYECRGCGRKFEKLIRTQTESVQCSGCGSARVSQLLSVFAMAGDGSKGRLEPGPCGACGAPERGSCGMN